MPGRAPGGRLRHPSGLHNSGHCSQCDLYCQPRAVPAARVASAAPRAACITAPGTFDPMFRPQQLCDAQVLRAPSDLLEMKLRLRPDLSELAATSSPGIGPPAGPGPLLDAQPGSVTVSTSLPPSTVRQRVVPAQTPAISSRRGLQPCARDEADECASISFLSPPPGGRCSDPVRTALIDLTG